MWGGRARDGSAHSSTLAHPVGSRELEWRRQALHSLGGLDAAVRRHTWYAVARGGPLQVPFIETGEAVTERAQSASAPSTRLNFKGM